MDKAHVEHAVGFVENDDFNLREIDRSAFVVIEQTAGRGREHFHAAAQHFGLRLDVHAAVDDADAKRRFGRVFDKAFVDLHGELARGRKDEHAHRMAGGRHRRVGLGKDALQCGKTIARGLAGAGLRGPHDVLTGQNDRNRLHLNRRGRDIAHFLYGVEDMGVKGKAGKIRGLRHRLTQSRKQN